MQKVKEEIYISIVIPAYNAEKYLTKTIHSILKQSFQHFEIILINDGSLDATEQIAEKFASLDARLKYITTKNFGVSAARNFGLKKAVGEFVLFFDADDLMGDDFLKDRYAYLKYHQEFVGCGSEVKMIDEKDDLVDVESALVAPSENALLDILLYTPGVVSVPSNFMFRKDPLIFHQILFDERLSSTADKLFLCRLANIGQLVHIYNSPLYYRIHPNSMYHYAQNKKIIFLDNEKFVNIIKKEHIVNEPKLSLVLKKNYYMLAGAAWNAQLYFKTLIYGLKFLLKF